jgi:hypothetical protein
MREGRTGDDAVVAAVQYYWYIMSHGRNQKIYKVRDHFPPFTVRVPPWATSPSDAVAIIPTKERRPHSIPAGKTICTLCIMIDRRRGQHDAPVPPSSGASRAHRPALRAFGACVARGVFACCLVVPLPRCGGEQRARGRRCGVKSSSLPWNTSTVHAS